MASSIRLIMERDDGSGLVEIYNRAVVFPVDQVATFDLVAEAFAQTYQWPATIDNPDFDAAKPAGEGNPETIPNPESKIDHLGRKLREFAESIVNAHVATLYREQASQQTAAAQQQIAAAFSIE